MISELCSAFVNVHADMVDNEINSWMAFIVTTLGVDRGTLFQISENSSSGVLTHTWAPTKSLSLSKNSIAELREGVYVLPWSVAKMLLGEHIVFSSLEELPDNATEDREFFTSQGTKSNVTFPLSVGGELIGALAFSAVSAERQWPEELLQRLQMVAHVFANALARKRADIELKDSAERYRALFESANDAILVLNENLIVECNLNCVPMFGCANMSDLIGRGPWELSPPQQDDGEASLDKITRLLDQALEGFPQSFYWKCRRHDDSTFAAEVSLNSFKASGLTLLLAIIRDISAHVQAKDILRESNDRLQAERALLGEKNAALRTILTQIEQQRIEYEEKVCSSLEHILTPVVKKLRLGDGRLNNKELTKLEDAVESIVGRGINTYKENFAKLTPRETEICELIVKGQSSKEISESLHVSPQTIHKHRELIRRKFNIQNLEINLPTYLRTKM